EAGDAGAAGADALGESPLRAELDLHLARQVLLGQVGVAAYEAADDARDLAVLEQHRQPLALVAAVVADDGEVLHPAAGDGLDAGLGVAAEAEPARHDGHPIVQQAGQRPRDVGVDLVARGAFVAHASASSSARPRSPRAAPSSGSVITRGGAK